MPAFARTQIGNGGNVLETVEKWWPKSAFMRFLNKGTVKLLAIL